MKGRWKYELHSELIKRKNVKRMSFRASSWAKDRKKNRNGRSCQNFSVYNFFFTLLTFFHFFRQLPIYKAHVVTVLLSVACRRIVIKTTPSRVSHILQCWRRKLLIERKRNQSFCLLISNVPQSHVLCLLQRTEGHIRMVSSAFRSCFCLGYRLSGYLFPQRQSGYWKKPHLYSILSQHLLIYMSKSPGFVREHIKPDGKLPRGARGPL